jgi:hypothetical protein
MVPVPSDVLPSKKVIEPVGPLEIVAVKVTEPPYVDGFFEDATLSVGVAFRVNVAVPLTDVFAWLVAVIVTVCGVVTKVGAVYNPDVVLIAPAPVVGLRDQVTAVFVLPTTVAVNCCVPPALTEAVAGDTVTESGMVYVAEATAELLSPLNTAIAFIVSVTRTEMALVYWVELMVGVLPSVV